MRSLKKNMTKGFALGWRCKLECKPKGVHDCT